MCVQRRVLSSVERTNLCPQSLELRVSSPSTFKTNLSQLATMKAFPWFKGFASLGLEFWLPLPLLGLLFWFGGGWVAEWTMARPQAANTALQASQQMQTQIPVSIVAIEVEIHRKRGFSKVGVKTTNPALKKLEYEFPLLEFEQVEAAIARELGMSRPQVRSRIQYEIKR